MTSISVLFTWELPPGFHVPFPLQMTISRCKCNYCWFSVSHHSKKIKIKIKTVQKIKSRILEMKGGKYAKTLAKIQIKGIFRIRDIRRNVLPYFIEICIGPTGWAPAWRFQHGGRKPTETSVTQFCYKRGNSFFENLINIKVILFLIRDLFR